MRVVLMQLHTELVKKELEVADLKHTLEVAKEDLESRRKVICLSPSYLWLVGC